MEQVTILTKEQQQIVERFAKSTYTRKAFYFTGGTALSEVYLRHRESVDLDFFSEKKIEPQLLNEILYEWSKEFDFIIQPQQVESTYIFRLRFTNGSELKVDFAYYPYKRLEIGKVYRKNIKVDSLLDIAVNKLLLINQRAEVKDFVDLYFILQHFSLWDLIEGVKIKFRMELEPLTLASDLLAVEEFDYLPKMLKPLSLEELQAFIKNQAQKIGRKMVR